MEKTIVPGQTIGIIGGGQLGRMMAIAAKEMGFKIAVLTPTSHSPCGQVADVEIVANFHDSKAIRELAEISDVITYEFENIDYQSLHWLETNAYLPQGSNLLSITQNRLTEKEAIQKAKLPVVPYTPVGHENELSQAVNRFAYPCVLKTRNGGYDGKGQVVIRSEADRPAASALIQQQPCILEDWLPFEKEISVIVNRNGLGETVTFPVSENVHVDHILHQSIVPARIAKEIEQKALTYALQLAETFQLIGTLAVEMFVMANGEIYINELAPRPHNSGHYTMDACETSQFQQHIRSICNWPLGGTRLYSEVVMVNLLGEHLDPALKNIRHYHNCKLHLYGKKDAIPKRKMGHLNILSATTTEALQKVSTLGIWRE